jgi:hypothetical protein
MLFELTYAEEFRAQRLLIGRVFDTAAIPVAA